MKWGEYSNDVQFILQRSDSNKTGLHSNLPKPKSSNNIAQPYNNQNVESNEKRKDNIKPLAFG